MSDDEQIIGNVLRAIEFKVPAPERDFLADCFGVRPFAIIGAGLGVAGYMWYARPSATQTLIIASSCVMLNLEWSRRRTRRCFSALATSPHLPLGAACRTILEKENPTSALLTDFRNQHPTYDEELFRDDKQVQHYIRAYDSLMKLMAQKPSQGKAQPSSPDAALSFDDDVREQQSYQITAPPSDAPTSDEFGFNDNSPTLGATDTDDQLNDPFPDLWGASNGGDSDSFGDSANDDPFADDDPWRDDDPWAEEKERGQERGQERVREKRTRRTRGRRRRQDPEPEERSF